MNRVNDLEQVYRQAANAAVSAEIIFRAEWRTRLEALERERGLAHRRMTLVTSLLRAGGEAADVDAARAACTATVAHDFGLERGRAAHEDIFRRFEPVADAVATLVHAPASAADLEPDAAVAELEPDVAAADRDAGTADGAEVVAGMDDVAAIDPPDVVGALAAFENWYIERYGVPFLNRADLPMPETPLVDW